MSITERPDLLQNHAPLAGYSQYEHLSLKELDTETQKLHSRINKLQNERDLKEFTFTSNDLPSGWEKVLTVKEGCVHSLDQRLRLDEFGYRIEQNDFSRLTWGISAEQALQQANQILASRCKGLDYQINPLLNLLNRFSDQANHLASSPQAEQVPTQPEQAPTGEGIFKMIRSVLSAPFILIYKIISFPIFWITNCFSKRS